MEHSKQCQVCQVALQTFYNDQKCQLAYIEVGIKLVETEAKAEKNQNNKNKLDEKVFFASRESLE